MIATRERFVELCRRIGTKDNQNLGITANNTYDLLVYAYTSPNRHYHDLGHIGEGLHELDEIRHLTETPDILEMAWWWHDIIYDTTINVNEEASAALANSVLKWLGYSDNSSEYIEFRIEVVQLILATKHDHITESKNCQLITDIDLVSLATPPEIFDQNTANIRKEYAHVSDKDFARGRAEFFHKFLEGRPSIYLTEYFKNKYETLAQENLKRIIATLKR